MTEDVLMNALIPKPIVNMKHVKGPFVHYRGQNRWLSRWERVKLFFGFEPIEFDQWINDVFNEMLTLRTENNERSKFRYRSIEIESLIKSIPKGDWYGYDKIEGDKFTAGYLLDRDQEPELREVAVFNCQGIAETLGNILAGLSNLKTDISLGGQDRKFKFEYGRFVNRVSGEPIPLSEPIIIFRARDHHSLPVLKYYLSLITDPHHRLAVEERIREFSDFKNNNPTSMKEPGITGDIVLGNNDPRNIDPDPGPLVSADRVFDAIKHGDDEHREWLREALDALWAGKSVPAPRGKGV